MEIRLYKNNSEYNKMGKELTLIETMQGTLREECSLQDPVILVEHNGLVKANYAYIPEFERYYFVKNITSVRNNLFRLTLHVDVLESFKNDIKRNVAVLDRHEHFYNLYQPDPLLPVESDNFVVTQQIGTKSFNNSILTLTVNT